MFQLSVEQANMTALIRYHIYQVQLRTSARRLSPTENGNLVAIQLVEMWRSSPDRPKDKGTRQKEFTQEMIKKKPVDDGDDIATTDINMTPTSSST